MIAAMHADGNGELSHPIAAREEAFLSLSIFRMMKMT